MSEKCPKLIFLIFFSRLVHYFFILFFKKIKINRLSNLTEADFRKKKLWANLGPKWPKNEDFSTFLEIGSLVFPDFGYESRGP